MAGTILNSSAWHFITTTTFTELFLRVGFSDEQQARDTLQPDGSLRFYHLLIKLLFYNRLGVHDPDYERADGNMSLFKTAIPTYRCPVDSVGDENNLRGGWPLRMTPEMGGANPIVRWSESDFWPSQIQTPRCVMYAAIMFFSYANSNMRIRDITDGTSNTIMVGAKCVIGRSGIWPGPRSNFHESDVVSDGSYASKINRSDTGYFSRHLGAC